MSLRDVVDVQSGTGAADPDELGTSAIVAGVVQPETPEAEVLLVGRWLRVDELGPLGWSQVTP